MSKIREFNLRIAGRECSCRFIAPPNRWNANLANRLIAFANVTFFIVLGLSTAIAASPASSDKNLPAPNFDANGRSEVDCKEIVDSQGKKYMFARMVLVTYKIPMEYDPRTCTSSVVLNVNWSNSKGLSAPSTAVVNERPFVVILSVPELPRRRDLYESYTHFLKFDQSRTPSEFRGLFVLSVNGKPTRFLISGEKGPKTPSGSPYLFVADSSFSAQIALPSGNSIYINDSNIRKHLNDWDRLFPALVALIQSFEQKN